MMQAVVTTPVCPLMTGPCRDCALADEALSGMILEVLEESTPSYWRVRAPYRYEGYAPVDCLAVGDEAAADWAARPKRMIRRQNFGDVMAQPDIRARALLTLPLGAVVAVGERRDGWQEVFLPDGTEGYVRAGLLDDLPPDPRSLPEEALRRHIVAAAMAYRGSQYRWGGKTPVGIDCSGLVSMAYLLNGIMIYRDAQLRPGFELVEIGRKDMAPGDVLFFPGHVALYLGGGRYVHATGRAGDDGVTVNSLEPTAPDYREDLAKSITRVGSYLAFHP